MTASSAAAIETALGRASASCFAAGSLWVLGRAIGRLLGFWP